MVCELEMSNAIEAYLQQQFSTYYKEVPLFSKRIDYVCIDDDEIIAIEAKVKNWQKALRQAITYRICADKVYIALWHDFISRVESKKDIFSNFGVGILEVDGCVRVILEAKKLSYTQQTPVKLVKSYIKQLEHVESI